MTPTSDDTRVLKGIERRLKVERVKAEWGSKGHGKAGVGPLKDTERQDWAGDGTGGREGLKSDKDSQNSRL